MKKQLAIGSCIRILQTAFPGMLPVTGYGFLAYSCAAARELHPLPCLCHGAKTRKPKDISKNRKYRCEEFSGWERGKSNRKDSTPGLGTYFRLCVGSPTKTKQPFGSPMWNSVMP